ncbi:MAG: hypothetical protein ABSF26_06325 [Thermoguttaceae bacterium]|jgi:hypothetical protein
MLRHRYGPVGLALIAVGLMQCAPGGAASAAAPPAKAQSPKVDFSYAFATPHRLTVGRPDSSDRTLLDLQPGWLRMAWTYEDLTGYPLAAFATPATAWDIHVTPQLDGRGLANSRWTRLDGFLPALDNRYEDPLASVGLKVLGGMTAALVRVEAVNKDQRPHQVVLRCESAGWGENRGWVEPAHWSSDVLLAGWRDRADRVVLLGLDADAYWLGADRRAPGPKTVALVWNLKPGQRRTGWLVRPYRAYLADVPTLRKHDWAREWEEAKQEWLALLERAARASIPDEGVSNALRACLADLFIMREPVAGGQIAAVPGTEVYRAPNAFEAAIVAVALDQMGLHALSAGGYKMCLEMQEPDGDWNDPRGWGHLMWGGAGFKAWAAMEHYYLTKDRRFLEWIYPRLAASSRWQEHERLRMRTRGCPRPVTYGLMPPGMGDAGLMNDGDLYGVFLPHNIWAVYADRLALEAAKILGRTADLEELDRIYRTGRDDLLEAMRRGAIQADGYRWLPGVPGKTSGSRWGVLNALTPCGLLPPDHELISGTLRHIESHLSPGGVPIHTGWMADGMWVAITLDNVAEAHLARGNGDAAAGYLYATLNHATPLYTWCEERGQEPGTTKCSGDRQHLWTPVAVVRAIRDMLVLEDGDGLQLALGADRSWLASGKPLGVSDAPTHFGRVSWSMQFDAANARVSGQVQFPDNPSAAWAAMHVRLPGGLRVTAIEAPPGAELLPGGKGLRWKSPRGKMKFTAKVEG